MSNFSSAFFVETVSRKIIQVHSGFRNMFHIEGSDEMLIGKNSTSLLLSMSKNFLDVEKFGEFYSRALDKREESKIQNIRINKDTKISVSYFYNKVFSCHYWEFSYS